MAMVKCPECGGNVSDQATSCPHCGVELGQCPECGGVIKLNAAKCPNCGVDLYVPDDGINIEEQNIELNEDNENTSNSNSCVFKFIWNVVFWGFGCVFCLFVGFSFDTEATLSCLNRIWTVTTNDGPVELFSETIDGYILISIKEPFEKVVKEGLYYPESYDEIDYEEVRIDAQHYKVALTFTSKNGFGMTLTNTIRANAALKSDGMVYFTNITEK